MPLRRWIESAGHAIEGIIHAAKTQRHVRYHFYAAVIILLISTILGVSRSEFIAISIVVIVVLATELMNTALEAAIDLFSLDFHPKARAAKDVAAGAVLITALGALIVGYVILLPPLKRVFEEGLPVVSHSKTDIALISLIIVLILVVLIKAMTGKGHPLKGGMPSGHAAFSFSVWVSITFMTQAVEISIILALVALAISASRVILKIHSLREVILGSLLGSGVTFLLFLVFT